MFVGDFNTEISEQRIESFFYMHELCNVVKEKTCFKNMQNPSCIDISLTNNVHAFQQTITIGTGLSDCHKLVLTVLKTTVPRSQPKEITDAWFQPRWWHSSSWTMKFGRLRFIAQSLSLEHSHHLRAFSSKLIVF